MHLIIGTLLLGQSSESVELNEVICARCGTHRFARRAAVYSRCVCAVGLTSVQSTVSSKAEVDL